MSPRETIPAELPSKLTVENLKNASIEPIPQIVQLKVASDVSDSEPVAETMATSMGNIESAAPNTLEQDTNQPSIIQESMTTRIQELTSTVPDAPVGLDLGVARAIDSSRRNSVESIISNTIRSVGPGVNLFAPQKLEIKQPANEPMPVLAPTVTQIQPTATQQNQPQPVHFSHTVDHFLDSRIGQCFAIAFCLPCLPYFLWRRRRYVRAQPPQNEAGTMGNRHWIAEWLKATPAEPKALSSTTEASYTVLSPQMQEMSGKIVITKFINPS